MERGNDVYLPKINPKVLEIGKMNITCNFYLPLCVVKDKKLTRLDQMLLSYFLNFCDEEGAYSVNIRDLMNFYGYKDSSIRNSIRKLCQLKYISKDKYGDISKLLKSKNMSGLGFGNLVCEWCKVKTTVLNNHHYPILKSKGGTETISICSNCHNEFHYYTNTIKIIHPKFKEIKAEINSIYL